MKNWQRAALAALTITAAAGACGSPRSTVKPASVVTSTTEHLSEPVTTKPAPTTTTAAPTTSTTSPPETTTTVYVVPAAATASPAASDPSSTATARCNDGTYSYAAHHQGACSHHGGVAEFYR